MQPIPVVYGMTIGEYAMMISGEQWLSPAANAKYAYYRTAENSKDTPFHFLVIKCGNYTHQSVYTIKEKPSPNLPDMASIYLYPSTCYFEGTVLSEGRGTPTPFQVFGHPSLPKDIVRIHARINSRCQRTKVERPALLWLEPRCPTGPDQEKRSMAEYIWATLLEAYKLFPDKKNFFILPKSGNADGAFFNKLAGNNTLMQQIIDGKS
jgi:hypothetical protein